MKKGVNIFIISCLIFLVLINLINLVVAVPSKKVGWEYGIFGCADETLCNKCSIENVGFCDCAEDEEPLIVGDCRGSDFELGIGNWTSGTECALSCPRYSYCDPDDGGCTLERIDCSEKSVASCFNFAGCYVDDEESVEKCLNCLSEGDHFCSDYNTLGACEKDICKYGVGGPDSAVCSSVDIQSCGCHWSEKNGCELGYVNEEGVFCTLTQDLGDCDENTNKALLNTSKTCGAETVDFDPRYIDCGRAVSPLPFFGLVGFVSVMIFIFAYYFFNKNFFNKKRK